MKLFLFRPQMGLRWDFLIRYEAIERILSGLKK